MQNGTWYGQLGKQPSSSSKCQKELKHDTLIPLLCIHVREVKTCLTATYTNVHRNVFIIDKN